MQANVISAGERSTVKLQGRFDFNAHRDFREAIDQALADAGSKEVVIELAEVDYLDSSALGMLLMLRDKAKSAGKAVSLANARGAVKQVLDIANFGKLFTIV
jgi:anti-anti-sigma factor